MHSINILQNFSGYGELPCGSLFYRTGRGVDVVEFCRRGFCRWGNCHDSSSAYAELPFAWVNAV